MRIGLLADIHEEVGHLREAIAAFRSVGVDRFVMLGDVFETGRHLEATVAALAPLGAVGVWGNHDFGLVGAVPADIRARFSPAVLAYFATLQPWAEIAGCRFQHIEPFLDSNQIEDLWSYGGEGVLDAPRAFAACDQPHLFMGHVHRWAWSTPLGEQPWAGERPIYLDPATRHLIAVHAVQQGWCAWYDLEGHMLHPIRVSPES